MKERRFHVASPEEIRAGKVTDIYFVRTEQILKAKGLDRRRGWAEFTTGELPLNFPRAVFCGLEEAVHLLEGLPVNLYALPEGTFFPAYDETGVRVPVMAIEGPYGRFCRYETPVLGLICQASGVATRAAAIRCAAGKATVLGFGTRRMHPAVAPMLDRASFIGGCDAVSGVAGAERIGQAPRGTMPHALIIAFGDARKAWAAFDEVMPPSVPRIALVDTYSDEKEEALRAAELLGKRLAGVRLDTPGSRRGDMPKLVREVRWELDVRGYRHVKILVSGGIDERQVPSLVQAGASGFGVGTAISNAPAVDFAMDLVEMDGRPCAKRGKLSGRKAPWGCPRCRAFRVLPAGSRAPACSRCKKKMRSLWVQVLRQGRCVRKLPAPENIRSYVLAQLRSTHG